MQKMHIVQKIAWLLICNIIVHIPPGDVNGYDH